MSTDQTVIEAFRDAAAQVPAYGTILREVGVNPNHIENMDDFETHVPVLDKLGTFGRFSVVDLCRGGNPGLLGGVMTSSGHSGRFSFGLYDAESSSAAVRRIDDAMDLMFGVRSKQTLLINCLPMGVKVLTHVCTVAETSVREDMVTALISEFGMLYDQIILVGDACFLKLVLELGISQGIDWKGMLVHAIVGEEPLAENARKYLESILGIEVGREETGIIGSSMGVAELGLNLFFEVPQLIELRRHLHNDPAARAAILGDAEATVPMFFTYDPSRIHVEIVNDDELVISTLDPTRPLPLIRYRTGDRAVKLQSPILADQLGDTPVLMVFGRGKAVMVGNVAVTPEQVKEGVYQDMELARQTTANFRLAADGDHAAIRIQLSPGVEGTDELRDRFAIAISQYVPVPLQVKCENYEDFRSGMSLDYERKFDYLGVA